MKILERAVIALFGLILLLCLVEVIDLWFASHNWKGLDASAWASWVQGIGSIAAIAGAFMIANRQHLNERKLQREGQEAARFQRVELISGVLKRIENRCNSVANMRNDSVFFIASRERVNQLRSSADLLGALPPFEMPSTSILMYCLSIQGHIIDLCDKLDLERKNLEELSQDRPERLDEDLKQLQTVVKKAIQACISLNPNL